jgi:chromosome segregation ATPase
MAGDTDAMSELPSISTNLLNLGKEQLESRDVYQDLFYDVDRKLKDAQDVAKSQYSVNKSQYDAQKSLLASQEAALDAQKVQYDAQNAKLNAQLSAQQAAYNTQIAQLNAQSAQLNAQNTSNYTLSDISSKISSLTAQLAKSTAQAASTPTTQNEALLQSKANQLNMIGYMGRTNWNSQSVQNAINASGMSLDQWWTNFGFGEGISSTYKSTTSTKYNSDAALLAAKAAKMTSGGQK